MTEFSPILLIHFTINRKNRPAFTLLHCSLMCVRELSIVEENNERIERSKESKL